jgi:hypothetical protein
MRALSIAILSATILSGCGDKMTPDPADKPDASVTDDAGIATQRLNVLTEVIDGLGVEAATAGDSAQLSLAPNGQATVAYGVIPPASSLYEIWFAARGNDGVWAKEKVISPGHLVMGASGQIIGLGLAHVGGQPHIAYLGGDDDDIALTPFPTDLMLAVKNGNSWTETVLVDRSNEAACECPNTQDTCNFGNMVGTHSALAATRDGTRYTAVYRDQHGGFARDDLARSDVEVVSGGASMSRGCVDPVRSGGEFANVTHTLSGRPVVAYNLIAQAGPAPRTGVWAAAFDGTTWTLTRVSEALALSKIAMATSASGTIWLAFSHADNVNLVVARSDDDGATWTNEVVDDDGKTGLHPGMTVDAMDRPVIAYGYCGRRGDTECPGNLIGRSKVMLARLEGGVWKKYLVDDGQGFGYVGLYNNVVAFPDGKLGVSFVDDMNGDLVFAKEQ